jgi:hypothetical protein
MAATEILLHRDLPVVNGYVMVPPVRDKIKDGDKYPTDKNRLTVAQALVALPGSFEVYLSMGSGYSRGSKHGAQRFLRLPGLVPGTSYTSTGQVDANNV